MASSIFLPVVSSGSTGTGAVVLATAPTIANPTITGVEQIADGTSGAPALAFASEPTLGFWRSGAGNVKLEGNFTALGSGSFSGVVSGASGTIYWSGRALLKSPADGIVTVSNFGSTTGSELKVDALPTIASGFGTNPAITAGSTPLAGSVNVGTGVPGTGGVINFNGTAFPSAPFVVCMNQTTLMTVRCTATTTQLTIAATALTAGDVVTWMAISSK